MLCKASAGSRHRNSYSVAAVVIAQSVGHSQVHLPWASKLGQSGETLQPHGTV